MFSWTISLSYVDFIVIRIKFKNDYTCFYGLVLFSDLQKMIFYFCGKYAPFSQDFKFCKTLYHWGLNDQFDFVYLKP